MGTKISRGFAVFVLGTGLAASGASAQTAGAYSIDDANSPPEAMLSHRQAAVSVDLLRHPMSAKVRQRLLQALEKMEIGDHEIAIEQLLETLKKYPDSSPYVHSLLGVEYVKTDRFEAAVDSFEQAALLLSHEAMIHYNFGLALICVGNYDRSTQEVQRALELDPKNARIRARLNALLEHKRLGNPGRP